MRRGLASLVMGLSLVVASASWAGFIMSRTVLDPGRSERLADHLLDNQEVRATITQRLADALEARIPPEIGVNRETIELGAETALDDPRVEALVRDGIVQAHRNALEGVDEPVTLDASALGAAARDAVVAERPELDPVLPGTPELEVELPNTGLAWLGRVKDLVDRFTIVTALISLTGIGAAFVLARNRPAALRRVAFWAFGASAFWILVAYAVPALLERLAPSSVAIAMAAVDVFFGAMIPPAVVLAGIGVALLVVSLAWPAASRRQRDARLDRPGRQQWVPSGPPPGRAGPMPGAPRPMAGAAPRPAPPSQPIVTSRAGSIPGRPSTPPLPPEVTQTFPQVISNPKPSQPPVPPPPPAPLPSAPLPSAPLPSDGPPPFGDTVQAPTTGWQPSGQPGPAEADTQQSWVEGVGYLDDGTGPDEVTERDRLRTDRLPTDRP